MAQAADQTTIDLTLEDNTPPPALQDVPDDDDGDDLDYLFDPSEYGDQQPQMTAPRFNRQQGRDPTEPITISDSDDEEVVPDRRLPQPPQSPEVQLIRQRQLPRRLPSTHAPNLPSLAEILRRPSSQPELRRATPPELRRADAQSFRDTLRNVPGAVFDFGRNMLGAAMGPVLPGVPPNAPQLTPFGHLPWPTGSWIARQIPTPLDPGLYDDLEEDDDQYETIDLDYHDVGFPMGELEILDPAAEDAAAAAAITLEDAYKPPPVAREGFTRDIQEDNDVLVCVACEDELATGDDEIKQQVWVSKSCGHVSQACRSESFNTDRFQVFCGSCASQRVTYRRGNDRERKKNKRLKTDQLKDCKAPGCNAKLTSKTAMFQVYL